MNPDKIAKFHEDCAVYKIIDQVCPNPNKFAPTLWHYTSADGLKGIVENKSLWFTEATFMNDASETTYGYQVFSEVYDDLVVNAQLDKKYTEQLLFMLNDSVSANGPIICSLCEEGNLLNQWRDYGKSETAYSIGFETDGLRDPDWNFRPNLFPVVYDRNHQKECMTRLIKAVLSPPFDTKNISNENNDEVLNIIGTAASQISTMIYRFKDPAFTAEREWRLQANIFDIIDPSHDLKLKIIDDAVKNGKTPIRYPDMQEYGFRTTGLGIVPYYCWKPNNPSLPISDIFVGPGPASSISEVGLRRFLHFNKYQTVETHVSTIPVR